MEPNVILIILRWFQWFASALIFGIAFTFFLYDVNFYIYIPTTLKAQVGLAGFLHIYMYLSAIWTSCTGGLSLFWAITDIVFTVVTLAVAGLSQPQTSTYCVNSLSWPWSDDYFAFIPPSLAPPDPSQTIVFSTFFLHLECGFFATVAAVAAILVILFVVSLFIQFRHFRQKHREIYRQLPQGNDYSISAPMRARQNFPRGIRDSLAPQATPLKLDRPQIPRAPMPERVADV